MNQSQYDHIVRVLCRISDSNGRDEATWDTAQVLAKAEPSFDTKRFYQRANVAHLEER